MTSLEVINKALKRLGAIEATSLADTAVNADKAIDSYADARDECLRLGQWPSCTKRARLLGWHEQATPWTASTKYVVGDRCTNDTAKTYECTTAGTSASATGPTGTSSGITDGTVIWDYMEASTTANNWCWVKSTAYSVGDLVSNNIGRVYLCITAGTSASSGGPTGETSDITDGTAHWRFYCRPGENLTIYDYGFIYPQDCLRILKIPDQTAADEETRGVMYSREGLVIYTNQDASWMKYIKREEDPTNWDDLLQTVVALKLAHTIAFDVTRSREVQNDVFSEFKTMLASASTIAVPEGVEGNEEPDSWADTE